MNGNKNYNHLQLKRCNHERKGFILLMLKNKMKTHLKSPLLPNGMSVPTQAGRGCAARLIATL